LWQLQSRRLLPAALLAVVATLASPLAGLFLGIIAVALLGDRVHRRSAFVIGASLVAIMAASTLAFPLPGRMPSRATDLLIGLSGCTAAIFAVQVPVVRRAAVVLAIAIVLAFFVPSSVGSNILRMSMLFGGAVVAGTSTLPLRKLIPIVAAFCAILSFNTVSDIASGTDRSTEAKFYAPLLQQLPSIGSANRIEVVDPETHSPALYVASQVPLARGWERQVDTTRNSIFYDGTLDATSYRQWLDDLAVKWVALPDAPLDYASRDEADLVQSGLSYLRLTWQNEDWKLYEVTNAAPLAEAPFDVTNMSSSAITLQSYGPASGLVRVQWNAGLVVDPAGTVERSGDWIRVTVPQAGSYELHYRFDLRKTVTTGAQ
jgi:hypothetical protein